VRVGRRTGARVVHSHFGHVGWGDADGARRLGAAHVVTFYGHDLSLPQREPAWGARYHEMFERAALVLAEGSHMAARIAALGCPPHKLRVHHLGVRVGDIRYVPRRWTPGTPLRVLIAASFREKKGIPYALEALARLRRDVPVEVTVIGDAGEQPAFVAEKTRILRTIAERRLDGCVRLLGYQPHAAVFEQAYRHHVFLSPSVTASDGDTEGGAPVTLTEMAATGMPIVSSRHCDIPEVVHDGVTGLLAAERDVDGLVERLRWLVASPDAWRPMLDAGRRHIEAEYDAERQGTRLAALYHDAARDAVPDGARDAARAA
jgi:colanic acid/amylovoran biosynthesis glycosyltransferase